MYVCMYNNNNKYIYICHLILRPFHINMLKGALHSLSEDRC